MSGLHNVAFLEGSTSALQVRYADGEQQRLQPKIFVGQLPANYGEDQLIELFAPFGEIEAANVLRWPDGSSRCCGFVKYRLQSSALHAIEAMSGYRVEGTGTCGLVVRWADTDKQRDKRRMEQRLTYAATMLANYFSYPNATYNTTYYPQQPPDNSSSSAYSTQSQQQQQQSTQETNLSAAHGYTNPFGTNVSSIR